MGPGRPPLDRRVYSFEDPSVAVPTDLLLDTSFVIHALIPWQRLHTQAAAYLERLVDAGTTIYFNRLLEVELAEVAFREILKQRHGNKGWSKMRTDGRARRPATRLTDDLMAGWRKLLTAFDHELRRAGGGRAQRGRVHGRVRPGLL